MVDSLEGKVAIVTGASSGIGHATATALAARGARVVACARRADRLADLMSAIERAGGQALSVTADVSKEGDVDRVIETAVERWNRVDILVNNAGIMKLGSVEGANRSDWRDMIEVNLLGVMYATQAVLPHMRRQAGGHIVNISSVSGRVVSARSAAYSASKFAVVAFTEGVRQEVLKTGIRVTVIEPGVVATELSDHISDGVVRDQVKQWAASMTPLAAQDVANAVMYAVTQPPHVNVNEILLRPLEQLP
jgi:NADP-dependent 3-hydroxy acid dehydrogenase YdfG